LKHMISMSKKPNMMNGKPLLEQELLMPNKISL
jgi:hypothetical protein